MVGAGTLTLSGSWMLVLLCAAVIGVGLGMIDLMVTQLLILGTGRRGPMLVNVAHGFFGVGTVAAPAVIAVIGPESYGVLFALIGTAGLLALVTMGGLHSRPTPADRAASPGSVPARVSTGAGLVVLVRFLLLYITHFGVQSGIGNWEPTYLSGLGYSDSGAAVATSGFWLAMVLGRFVAAVLTTWMRVPVIVVLSCLGMVVSLLPALSPDLFVWAILACGFFIGPIFPNGLTWLAHSRHGQGERFAYVMAASMVGMAVTPWALGWAIETAGLHVFPVITLGIAAVALAASMLTVVVTQKKH